MNPHVGNVALEIDLKQEPSGSPPAHSHSTLITASEKVGVLSFTPMVVDILTMMLDTKLCLVKRRPLCHKCIDWGCNSRGDGRGCSKFRSHNAATVALGLVG